MLDKLGLKTPVLLDGAMGTELQRRGLEAGKSTIAMNIEHPQAVTEVHTDYIEAGSQIITANTFAGNHIALKRQNIEESEEQLNLQGMRLAKQVASGLALTAADIGPTGEFHQKDFDFKAVRDVYLRQARLLMRETPDLFLLETFFNLQEAMAAVEGVKIACGEIPLIACMTFNKTPRGFFTIMGDAATEAMKKLIEAGAEAVGVNCTLTPKEMINLVKEIRDAVSLTVVMQPNAGQPTAIDGKIVYDIEEDEFAEGLVKLYECGADIIGGCCGSTPKMIKIVASMLMER